MDTLNIFNTKKYLEKYNMNVKNILNLDNNIFLFDEKNDVYYESNDLVVDKIYEFNEFMYPDVIKIIIKNYNVYLINSINNVYQWNKYYKKNIVLVSTNIFDIVNPTIYDILFFVYRSGSISLCNNKYVNKSNSNINASNSEKKTNNILDDNIYIDFQFTESDDNESDDNKSDDNDLYDVLYDDECCVISNIDDLFENSIGDNDSDISNEYSDECI